MRQIDPPESEAGRRSGRRVVRRPPTLSPRLHAIVRMVPRGARVIDVGAGHGLVPLWLVTTGRAAGCIATERSPEAGPRLSEHVGTPGLEVRFGDGLRVLEADDRVDVLVMSGQGARTMLGILAEDPARVRAIGRLVLQPQTEPARLRRWLLDRRLAIVDERLVVDRGRFYVVLAARTSQHASPPTHARLDLDDLLEAGPCLVRSGDPLVREYWTRVHERLSRVVRAGPEAGRRGRAERRLALASRVLRALDGPRDSGSAGASPS